MANRKKSPVRRTTKSRTPGNKKVAKKTARKASGASRTNAPQSRAFRERRAPETLRLKSFTPSLTVGDLRRSIAFYTEALGFFVGESWTDGDALRGVMLKAGACELGLSQDDWKLGRDRKKGVGFRIWCDTSQSVDALAARVKSAGFKLTEEAADHTAWGVRSFSLDDPDGFHITIARNL